MKAQQFDATASLNPRSRRQFFSDVGSNEAPFKPALNHGGKDKQVWVWSFADALMCATDFKIEHMDALDAGYRLWPSQGWRSPVEVASERWVRSDDERP